MNNFHTPTMAIPIGPWVSNREVISKAAKNALTVLGSEVDEEKSSLNIFDGVEGTLTYIKFNENCIAQIIDVQLAEPLSQKAITDEGWIGFQFALSGEQVSVVDGYGQMNFSGPRFNICATGHSTKVAKFYMGNNHVAYINVIVRPDFLVQQFGADYNLLPTTIQSIIDGRKDNFYSATLPLSSKMSLAAETLLQNQFQGKLKETYAKIKITELLCLAVHTISNPCDERENKIKLNDREIRLLNKVRDDVQINYASPPPLSTISRNIGLNRNKLTMGFKELFGTGVYEYYQSFRMNEARKLLRETKLSILEVAFEVGFQNQSSFSRAYKDFFDRAPSQDRQ